jgi:lipopolysaccharide/colanic/teichoic acid biosynthesis glycosyltransferase
VEPYNFEGSERRDRRIVVFGASGHGRRAACNTRGWKRVLDVVISAAALLCLAPLLALIACAIQATMGRPVLFRARRPGLRTKPFTLLKFRTMKHLVDPAGNLLPDKDRITRLGRVLRRTSLDELPQLINVLEGEMSLVGPRPLKLEYLQLYTTQQARRHDVRPGITGLAQINGRNTLSWEDRFALDVWYVDHVSLSLDLRILLQTVVYVLRRRSVSADGDLDVPSFTGSLSAARAEPGAPALVREPS